MSKMNWNEMSSSEEDSWFDDDEKGESTKVQKAPQSTSKPVEGQKTEEKPSQTPKASKQQSIQPTQGDKVEKKRVHLTDEELLQKYVEKTVDDPKAIKVVGCHNEEARDMIKNLENARVVELNETTFLLFFTSQQGLQNFVKEKIANRYRFYLSIFENRRPRDQQGRRDRPRDNRRQQQRRRKPRGQKEDFEQRDRDHRQKKDRRQKGDRQQRGGRGERTLRPERGQKGDNEKRKRHDDKEEQKQKKVYVIKDHFDIKEKSNTVNIHSDAFDVNRVIEQIQRNKITSEFSRIYIKTPYNALTKVSHLCQQIATKWNFCLQGELPKEEIKDSVCSLTLVQKPKVQQKAKPQEYRSKAHQQPKQPKKVVAEELRSQHQGRLLGGKFDEYFADLTKCNVSEIVKGFDEHQYIKRLRDASKDIQKQWSSWKIQAEEDFIQVLLKLTNRIKKSTIYDIELKPSLRDEKALLTAELRNRPQNERRPKVDVSNVNNYLS